MRKLCFALCLTALIGCFKDLPVERIEWPVMGTVAALQTRGADVDKDVMFWVKNVFGHVVEEFDAHDPKSAINRLERCTAFGRPCWDFAFKLKDETQGAFDPYWQGTNRLDFGAVAKGFAVDVAADTVKRNVTKADDLLIDLGGNLKAVRGDWTVGVKDGASFVLKEGAACATSATYYRGHHIRDARTGKPVSGGVHSVTVIHPSSAMVADGLSTVLFILGKEKGEAFLRERHPEARAIWISSAK